MKEINWKQYLMNQAVLHPGTEPQDVYKMMFQAAYGAEHILQDEEAAYAYIKKEFEEVMPEEELLYEQIGADVYRVNLRAWKKKNMPLEWLFRMFVGSVSQKSAHDRFLQYVEETTKAVKEGVFSFSYEEFSEYTETYNQTEPHAVHHSERYRESERPAYRLVSGKYLRVLPILEAVADWQLQHAEVKKSIRSVENDTCEMPTVITIDGRCASGKSTMAQILSEITGAGIIHMDDFFLPPKLRTEERLAQPGGNVHYERFQEEVLPFLKEKGAFSYRRFDCSRMALSEERVVADSTIRIVEGAYSNHPVFGEYADLRVFSDVASEEQLERIVSRDGEDMLTMFKERWIPMEEKYFTAYGIRDNATIII